MSDMQIDPQTQPQQPGVEQEWRPEPVSAMASYRASARLANKVALISGGESGIGRAVAIGFAKEGADVVITYLDEHEDARETLDLIGAAGVRGLAIPGDVGDAEFCRDVVMNVVQAFGRIDILVNNAAEQHLIGRLEDLADQQLERVFRTNVFSQFFLTRAVLPHMPDGGAIVNTTSITAYQGNPTLVDFASTMGAVVGFTRSMAKQLMGRGIRVNGVAPGPILPPLVPASFSGETAVLHGEAAPLGRGGQPDDVAPCYIFLASSDSAFMSGQVLHPNGGTVVNG